MRSEQSSAHDRGAVLVHVALAMLALIAFTTFVVDYGVLWVGRRHAQNAADGGALAAAQAFAFDAAGDKDAAKETGAGVAKANLVFGEIPAVDPATDVNFVTCPPGAGEGTCVKVDVYRDQAHANPLPMFFGPLVGLTQQNVRATATARISGANAVRCTLPWATADRWADDEDNLVDETNFPGDGQKGTDGWTPNDAFEAPGDTYKAPYEVGHTGWTTTKDFGRQLILHPYHNQYSAGWAGIVNLPGCSGADCYLEDGRGCNEAFVAIAAPTETCSSYSPPGTTTVPQALAGCLGVGTGWVQGPTQGIVDKDSPPAKSGEPLPITMQDPDAYWSWGVDGGPNGEKGGILDKNGNLNMTSPRVRPLPIFDINHYLNQGCSGSICNVKIVNIVGFFIEGTCSDLEGANKLDLGLSCFDDSGEHPNSQVVGRIVTLPGSFAAGGGAPVDESSFVKIIVLVR